MKLETKFLKPNIGTFIKYLILAIIPFYSLGILIYIFTASDPFEVKMYSWWTSLILFPIGIAVGLAFGTRRFQLIIADAKDLGKAKNLTLDILSSKGLEIKSKNDFETILQSSKSYNQIFGNWFGTELISVKMQESRIIIDGPFRFIEKVDVKLKFGKVMFD